MVQAPPLVVYVHFIAALAATAIGAVQLARPKGTAGHRVIGWTWAALMMVVALSSLWIPAFLAFTWIHLFTLFVMVTLPLALYRAHRGEVAGHAKGMRGIYVGGLIVAGVFAFMPGRVLGNLLWKGVWGYLPRA
ncbi:MAG: DUF2306 domain-containing protein [Betaproteobacteria bacterium]|nr:DUF2306 domain-containing protein [Betaproteobacteria bacterium]